MKAILVLLFAAALLHAEEPATAPAPASAASAVLAAIAGGASSPSEPNPARRGRRAASRPPLRAEVSLIDGSILKGTLRQRFLPAVSPSLGRVRIDLAKVERIDFIAPDSPAGSSAGGARSGRREGAGGAAEPGRGATSPSRIAFRNGDRLTVRFPADRAFVTMDALVGRVRVPFDKVSSLAISGPPDRRTARPQDLLYHCTFDSPESISRPAAGPAGTFLGGEFVPGKKGNALRIPGNVPTALVDLPRGMMQPRGTIEFWSKIEDPPASYGDRGNPRFFGLSLFDDPANPGPCSTYLQFTSNDGMGMSGLCGMIYHRAMATDPHMRTNTYGPLLEDPAAWHHYAIVWDSNGLSFSKASDGTPAVAAIVLDGRVLQTFGRNQSAHGKGLLRLPELQGKLAFPVADTGWGFFPRPVVFLIDEFKIWSVPKTDFGIDARPVRHYKPELLYHCTFDSAESVEKSAAGPNGKFLGGEFVPGKVGNALRSPGDSPVAEVDLSKGLLQPRGTIEFWAKIEEPPAFYGDRGNPLFFGLWLFDNLDDPGLCSTHLGWCANNGMGMAGLCGMVYHRAMATDPTMRTNTYGPLLSDPAAWHHYAIVWDSEGLPSARASDGTPAVATLVLDGRVLQTFGRNQQSKGEGLLKLPSFQGKLAFPVPAARWGNPGNHVPFLIDEFKIWSAPKTDFAIPPAAAEPPRLLYHCTFDDAAAIERPAAGPSGKYLGGDFVPGKQGTALRVYADVPAAQTAFKPGDLGRRGMFEFWAKMEEATMETVFGDGGNPRFFCLWADLDKPGANPRSTYLQWSGNDGSGRSGLCAMVSGCTATSEDGWGMRRYPAFLGNPSDWHHYAVVWDENGVFGSSSVVAVYVDGKLVSTGGRNELGLGRKFKSFLDGPVLLGFPQRENEREPAARHVPFLIDEFKIWSAPVVPTAASSGP